LKPSSLGAAALAALALAQGALAQAPMPRDTGWSLRLPKQESVTYRGLASFDGANAGSLNNMLYPAPNLLIGLAAVLTHGVVADAAQERQKQQIQENANRVLVEYRPILNRFKHEELMQKGLALLPPGPARKLVAPDAKVEGEWLVESAPVFSMTQDRRALVLDNAVVIYAPGATEKPAYQNVMRVVSRPRETEDDLFVEWADRDGEPLKAESAFLFAHSLEVALNEAASAGKETRPQRTYRYMEGRTERMERAELVSEQCSRVVVRTLRGWLLSIPVRNPPADCKS
jgi:hypothetical protein